MTREQEREWVAIFRCAWSKVRLRLSGVHLPAMQDWEDLRSQAMIRVFQKAHTFEPAKSQLYSWMMTVAYRTTLNGLRWWMPTHQKREKSRVRRAKRLVTWQLEDLDEGTGRPVRVPVYDVVDAQSRFNVREIDGFTQLLTTRERKVFMWTGEGRSAKQIGKRLDITPSNVYHVVYRIGRRYRQWSEQIPSPPITQLP